jgi:hypothetical protein
MGKNERIKVKQADHPDTESLLEPVSVKIPTNGSVTPPDGGDLRGY